MARYQPQGGHGDQPRGTQPGRPLPITFVCTGNSRRSILGATMGNVAAAYYGLPEVRCYSGGTAPTAFNPRTAATLSSGAFPAITTLIGNVTVSPMARLPLVLIPAFMVPFFTMLHLSALFQARQLAHVFTANGHE